MPWLPYGINRDGELINIADTPRGKTDLVCPYCGRGLTAKRGEIVEEHFAHTEATCWAGNRKFEDLPILPCYDNFNLHISGKDLALLRQFYETGSIDGYHWKHLEREGLVRLNEYGYPAKRELTKIGKIPFGELSMKLFEAEQLAMFWGRHTYVFEDRVKRAQQHHPAVLPEALTDLRIFRAQWRRVISTTLYFLQIQAGEDTFHKIGVTNRDIEERLPEIYGDLRQHYRDVKVKVLDTWPHRGNVELYFKHRYAKFQFRLGNLTEYFRFAEPKKVLTDLRRMGEKEWRRGERAIYEGLPSEIEQEAALFLGQKERQAAIKLGMQRAAAKGTHVGRPAGSGEDIDAFLAKASSQKVIEALEQGMSLRKAAAYAGVALNTVVKVQKLREKEVNDGTRD
jgi:hypothetical protein